MSIRVLHLLQEVIWKVGKYSNKVFVVESNISVVKARHVLRLAEKLNVENSRFKVLTNTPNDLDKLDEEFIAENFGEGKDINRYVLSCHSSLDRFSNYSNNWKGLYDSGKSIVVSDYTSSTAIHTMSRLPKSEWSSYLNWLYGFEFVRLGLPIPSTVYLDVDPNLFLTHSEDYNADSDHVYDLEYLEKLRDVGLYCAEALGWMVLPCDNGSAMYSFEEMSNNLKSHILPRLES